MPRWVAMFFFKRPFVETVLRHVALLPNFWRAVGFEINSILLKFLPILCVR